MAAKKLYKTLLLVEGLYSLVTSIWPLVHIDSFMAVTGPKVDIWLVKTVSLLIGAIAVFFLVLLRYASPVLPVAALAITMSAGLIFVDFYYPAIDRISNVYIADGVLQIIFLLTWVYLLSHRQEIDENLFTNKKV